MLHERKTLLSFFFSSKVRDWSHRNNNFMEILAFLVSYNIIFTVKLVSLTLLFSTKDLRLKNIVRRGQIKTKNSLVTVTSHNGAAWIFVVLVFCFLKTTSLDLSSLSKYQKSRLQDHIGLFRARIELRQTRRVPPSCKRTCIVYQIIMIT